MMGLKRRVFAPMVAISLEDLVPQDHLYRHLQKVRDLSCVSDLVRESYAMVGRPSIDPVVFLKRQLIMFFEDVRSERLLMRLVAARLSVRWYLGYNLGDPLPDHSSLSRIRTRFGLDVFRHFFDAVLEQCQQAKLIWGKELSIYTYVMIFMQIFLFSLFFLFLGNPLPKYVLPFPLKLSKDFFNRLVRFLRHIVLLFSGYVAPLPQARQGFFNYGGNTPYR